LEDFKFSHVPGLFPIHIDASGCRYEEAETPKQAITVDEDEEESETQLKKRAVLDERQLAETQGRQPDGHLEDTTRADMGNAMRESLTESDNISDEPGPVKRPKGGPSKSSSRRPNQAAQKCEPQGLIPSICNVVGRSCLIAGRTAQEFSMGGESDSAYEYFIKEYVLLGGLEDQYRKLYTDSVIAARQNLFYRPLVEGDPDILFSGKFRSYYNDDGTQADGVLMGEMSHLVTCYGSAPNNRHVLLVEWLPWVRKS
jgi:mannosyl-oligosaccharide alpha-1,2-mannosidase